MPSAPCRARAPAFLERLIAVDARHLPGRRQPEKHARQDSDPDREQQHVAVKADGDAGRKTLRSESEQQPDTAVSHGQSRERSRRGQHQAFRQRLPDQAPPASAQRGAHRNLAAARGRPHEHQPGDVRARDE